MKKTAVEHKNDIIEIILEDHKPLKALIAIMKDTEKKNILERSAAFEEFAPLLLLHAKPEEESLYQFMKKHEDVRVDAFEGDVEHKICDELIEEIHATDYEEDLWSARVKVLAELVEHHIEEEEEEMFPEVKKIIQPQDREILGNRYLNLRRKFEELSVQEAKRKNESIESHATHSLNH